MPLILVTPYHQNKKLEEVWLSLSFAAGSGNYAVSFPGIQVRDGKNVWVWGFGTLYADNTFPVSWRGASSPENGAVYARLNISCHASEIAEINKAIAHVTSMGQTPYDLTLTYDLYVKGVWSRLRLVRSGLPLNLYLDKL